MSPAAFHGDTAQRLSFSNCTIKNNKNAMSPPSLKINKGSHVINKNQSTLPDKPPRRPQHRSPVIIYTQAPKIIKTSPADFMALVQRLTGQEKKDNPVPPQDNPETGISSQKDQERKSTTTGSRRSGDSETSSAISDGNSCCSMKSDQMNACMASPIFNTLPNPSLSNFPVYNPNPASFYLSDQSLSSYTDPFFLSPDVSSSLSTLEDIAEFHEY